MLIQLTSGEQGSIEVIPRKEAIEILSKPVSRRTWFGIKYRATSRNSRGPGSAVDIINYGLRVGDKCRAVMRIGNAPWRNTPVIAAVGSDLAQLCLYVMRTWASGITSDDLVTFLRHISVQFPKDMLARYPQHPPYRYLLSLDSMAGWLIEDAQGNIFEAPPVAGRIYHQAGALYAGVTKTPAQPTRYLDPERRQLKSVYNAGRNTITELRKQGIEFFDDGPKHRFVFVLAEKGSLEYTTYRAALPPNVREFTWGEGSLGWVQPRLLTRLLERLRMLGPAVAESILISDLSDALANRKT